MRYIKVSLFLLVAWFGASAQGGFPGGGSNITATSTAARLPHWAACAARVKINAGNCRVYAVGDSTTFGTFSNGTNTGNLPLASYPTRLSQFLNSAILPAQRNSFMGDGSTAETTGVNDPRVTLGSWVQAAPSNSQLLTTGGALFTATAGATPLAFLPTDAVDTFRIWYIHNLGLGSFSYGIDGGAPTTVSENATPNVASVTVAAGSLASHTLNLTWISASAFIIGVEAYNSAISSVQIVNAGWPSSTTANWITNPMPWSPLRSVAAQAPDVVLLDLGINDWRATTPSVATYTANMQALIASYSANSDVILVTPAPSAIDNARMATQQQYVNAMYVLAATNNIPIIDNFSRWGSYELKNPAPYLFYGQVLHPNANGYSDFAQAIATQLLLVAGN